MGTNSLINRWKHFKMEEFACHHCGENRMDPEFIDKLDLLRERVNFPLVIGSGYRCPEHNVKVSTTGPSGPHTTGRAVDISVDRERAYLVLGEALRMSQFTGIGVHQKKTGRFLHLDDLTHADGFAPRPTVWSY